MINVRAHCWTSVNNVSIRSYDSDFQLHSEAADIKYMSHWYRQLSGKTLPPYTVSFSLSLPRLHFFFSFPSLCLSLCLALCPFYPPRSGGELNTSHARESHQIGCQRLLQASPLQGWVRHESADRLTDTHPLPLFAL